MAPPLPPPRLSRPSASKEMVHMRCALPEHLFPRLFAPPPAPRQARAARRALSSLRNSLHTFRHAHQAVITHLRARGLVCAGARSGIAFVVPTAEHCELRSILSTHRGRGRCPRCRTARAGMAARLRPTRSTGRPSRRSAPRAGSGLVSTRPRTRHMSYRNRPQKTGGAEQMQQPTVTT